MRKHTAARARQRFGVDLCYMKQLDIVRKIIAKSEDIIILQQRRSREVLAVKYDNRWMPAVYDSQKNALVTILPRAAFIRYNFTPVN